MPAKATAPPSLTAAISGRRRPLISLTPLIDVVFILLVFFMLASSFLDWRAIDLTPPARAGAGTPLEGAMLVDVRPDGLRLSGERLDLETLAGRVEARLAKMPDQSVIVRPAAGVSLQDTIRVLDRLAVAGAANLSLNRAGGR
ncbi:ExbD/TolR family protein [Minwuia thermotolerans]|uniref:Biopolymer transporter ExbD n=1 Tax=Minwuia thermotolerans TaxID=2056226 RepID=A0A2M9FVC9_9PROT|nr:biopolymer transporter ExbD [Minwuia thermotolerans]PJK27430.1 biopolymer transporter ExbD [Minwuia thermotolerans]